MKLIKHMQTHNNIAFNQNLYCFYYIILIS